MNNFNQKNILYNLTGNSSLPTKETIDVSLKTNQIIYTAVNNAFQKMVNNDLYIERSIINNSNYNYGPDSQLEISSINENTPIGTKYWDGLTTPEVELSILQTYQTELSNTLSARIPHQVNTIFSRDNATYAGSTAGLYIESTEKLNFKLDNTILSAVAITDYFYTQNDLTLVASTNGLYNIQYLPTGPVVYKFPRSEGLNITKVITVEANNIISANTIIVGTHAGLYTAEYTLTEDMTIASEPDFVKSEYFTDIDVTSINKLQNGKFILGSTSGLYESDIDNFLTYPKNIAFQGQPSNITCSYNIPPNILTSKELSSVTTLVGTETGLYYISKASTLVKLAPTFSGKINQILDIGSNIIVADSQGAHQYNQLTDTLDSINAGSAGINSICYQFYDFNHTYLYAAKANSISYVNIYDLSSLTELRGANSTKTYVEELDTYIWKTIAGIPGAKNIYSDPSAGYIYSETLNSITKYRFTLNLEEEPVLKKLTKTVLPGPIINTAPFSKTISILNTGKTLVASPTLAEVYTYHDPLQPSKTLDFNSVDILDFLTKKYCFINTNNGVISGVLALNPATNNIEFTENYSTPLLPGKSYVRTFIYDVFFIFQQADIGGTTTIDFINYQLYPNLSTAQFIDSLTLPTPKGMETLSDGLYILGTRPDNKILAHHLAVNISNLAEVDYGRSTLSVVLTTPTPTLSAQNIYSITTQRSHDTILGTESGLYSTGYDAKTESQLPFTQLVRSPLAISISQDNSRTTDWYGDIDAIYCTTKASPWLYSFYNYPLDYVSGNHTLSTNLAPIISANILGIDVICNCVEDKYSMAVFPKPKFNWYNDWQIPVPHALLIDNYTRFISTKTEIYVDYPEVSAKTLTNLLSQTNGNLNIDSVWYSVITKQKDTSGLEDFDEVYANLFLGPTSWKTGFDMPPTKFNTPDLNSLFRQPILLHANDIISNMSPLSACNLVFIRDNHTAGIFQSLELSSSARKVVYIHDRFPPHNRISNICFTPLEDNLYACYENHQAYLATTGDLSSNIVAQCFKTVNFETFNRDNVATLSVDTLSVYNEPLLSSEYFSVNDTITHIVTDGDVLVLGTSANKIIASKLSSFVNNKLQLTSANSFSFNSFNKFSDIRCIDGHILVAFFNATIYAMDIKRIVATPQGIVLSQLTSISLQQNPGDPQSNNKCEFTVTQLGSYVSGYTRNQNYPAYKDACAPVSYKIHYDIPTNVYSFIGSEPEAGCDFKMFSTGSWFPLTVGYLNYYTAYQLNEDIIITAYKTIDNSSSWLRTVFGFNKYFFNSYHKLAGSNPIIAAGAEITCTKVFNRILLLGTTKGLYFLDSGAEGYFTKNKAQYSNVKLAQIMVNSSTALINIKAITSYNYTLYILTEDNKVLAKTFSGDTTAGEDVDGIIFPTVSTVLNTQPVSFEEVEVYNKSKYDINRFDINSYSIRMPEQLYKDLVFYSSTKHSTSIYGVETRRSIYKSPTATMPIGNLTYPQVNSLVKLNDGLDGLYIPTTAGIYSIISNTDLVAKIENNLASNNISRIYYANEIYYTRESQDLSSISYSEYMSDDREFIKVYPYNSIKYFNTSTDLQTIVDPKVQDIYSSPAGFELVLTGYETTPVYITNHAFHSLDPKETTQVLTVPAQKFIDSSKFISNYMLMANIGGASNYTLICDTKRGLDPTVLSGQTIINGIKTEIQPEKYFYNDNGKSFVFYKNCLFDAETKNEYHSIYNLPLYLDLSTAPKSITIDTAGLINMFSGSIYYTFNETAAKYLLKVIRNNLSINTLYTLSDNTWLLGTTKGLFRFIRNYFQETKTDFISSIPFFTAKNVTAITTNEYIFSDVSKEQIKTFVVAAGNTLYSSPSEMLTWTQVVSLAKVNVNTITCLNNRGKFEYLIGTDKGLYNTKYEYYLKNTLNLSDVSLLDTNISAVYNKKLADHILDFHNDTSIVTKINDTIMPVDFSEIDETWQTSYSTLSSVSISNDIVETVDFNDDSASYIKASYSNYTTYDKTTKSKTLKPLPNPSYIVKTWKSGLKESYIYLPTTNTYYINHNENTPTCGNFDIPFPRDTLSNNLPLIGSLRNNYTLVKLDLDNTYFKINDLVDIEVNANSLPLKIYKDTSVKCNGAEQCFHSFILPTIVVDNLADPSENKFLFRSDGDKLSLWLVCYGSDAQAIRLTTNSIKTYQLIFNAFSKAPGTISGTMDDQLLRTDKLPENITLNKFTKAGAIFTGWSLDSVSLEDKASNADTIASFSPLSSVALTNGREITDIETKLFKENSKTNLYPVFSPYVFSKKDTILELNAEPNVYYRIDNLKYIDNFQTAVLDTDIIN